MIQLPVGQAKELVREIVAQLLILQGLARRAPQLGHLGVVFGALELCVFPTGRPLRRSGQQGVDQSSVLAGGMPHQAVDSLPYWLAFFRSEEHTSELQSLMRISYAVFCLNKKNTK